MPVTIKPSSHRANPINNNIKDEDEEYEVEEMVSAKSATQLLVEADSGYRSEEDRGALLRSSFGPEGDELSQLPDGEIIFALENGLVRAAAAAYSSHHHLVIRPEDIWNAITMQLRFYINGHAEELRSLLVPHQGRKTIEVKVGTMDGTALDVPSIVRCFGELLDKNVLDPSLRRWFIPDFSTTTSDDITVTSIVAMGAYSSYFSYWVSSICGLPSVTLLGERADYEKMLERLDRLCEFGPEPTEFCSQLRPILRRCVRSFDFPEEQEIKEFWNNICTMHSSGCGGIKRDYSGWITAFCFWQPEGKRTKYYDLGKNRFGHSRNKIRLDHLLITGAELEGPIDLGLTYDGVTYHSIEIKDVPAGFVKVPVKLQGLSMPADEAEVVFLAGSVAIRAKTSGEVTTSGAQEMDTLQPQLGWFMYTKKESS